MISGTMNRSEPGSATRSGLWWGLWSVLMALPWLVPTHAQPWTGFHADAAMAIAAGPLLVWAASTGPSRFTMPFEVWVLAGLAIVPLAQGALGLIDFAGDAWLAAIYVFGLATAVTVGARAQSRRSWTLANALFVSFSIASVASVPLMLAQWQQWEVLGTLLMSLPAGARLSANLGQPNQLATLLVWGLLGLCWAYERSRIHGGVLWLLAVILLAGVAMTQSRAGALEVLLMACAVALFRRQFRVRKQGVALVALGVWFVVASAAWPTLDEVIRPGRDVTRSLQEQLSPGTRLLHWSLLLDAVATRPWFGWGWNQIVHAQGQLAAQHPASHEVLQYGHNVFLDLVLWNGVPIGALAGLSAVAWFAWQLRLAQSAERVLVLLAIAAFLLHAMVELPHGYLLFLLPVGLMVGILHVPMGRFPDVTVTRVAVAVPFGVLATCAVVIMRDYNRIEEAWMAHRFRAARIGTLSEVPMPPIIMLSNMQALLYSVRTEPWTAMRTEELTLLRQVSLRYPSVGGLFRYAWALALTGDSDGATHVLVLLCRLHTEAQCVAAKQAWMAKSEQENRRLAAVWPAAH